MTDQSKDTQRAIAAAKVLIDGRDIDEGSPILVTLDHLIALVLLVVMKNNPRKAVGMLNEGVVPGVEDRIGIYAAKAWTL